MLFMPIIIIIISLRNIILNRVKCVVPFFFLFLSH